MLGNLTAGAMEVAWRGLVRPVPDAVIRSLARALFSRSWARFERAARDPGTAQTARLLQIVERNRETEFGRQHGFDRIRSIGDYQRQVPIQNYDDLEPAILRMTRGEPGVLTAEPVVYFGRTSGTSGTAKYIPVTRSFVDEYLHGRRVWTRQVAQAFPGLVRGSVLTIRSTHIDGTTPSGIPYGPIGIPLGNRDPDAAGPLQSLRNPLEPTPRGVFDVPDYETRYYLLLRFALASRVSLLATINPSTLALLCRKLTEWADDLMEDCRTSRLRPDLELAPDLRRQLQASLRPAPRAAQRMATSLAAHGRVRPIDVWPDLCGLLCWKGGNAPFYLEQFPAWFGDLPVMDYCYAATEGNFNVVLGPHGNSGPAAADGHFMEFVPADGEGAPDGPAASVDQLDRGQIYRVVLTASNGLYRYDLNDLVRVTGFYHKTPELAFLHKAGSMTSFTGEKLSESQVTAAIGAALNDSPIRLAGFCVGVQAVSGVPRYVLAVEPVGTPARADLAHLLRRWEEALERANLEYRAKRVSLRLGNPSLQIVEPGAFDAWRRRRVEQGASDGQVKLPHLTSDPEVLRQLGVKAILDIAEET